MCNYHEGQAALRHYANQPVFHDFCDGIPISHLLNRGVNACLAQCLNSVLNVKVVVATFNQETSLVGAFSVIVQLHLLIVSFSLCQRNVNMTHNMLTC